MSRGQGEGKGRGGEGRSNNHSKNSNSTYFLSRTFLTLSFSLTTKFW